MRKIMSLVASLLIIPSLAFGSSQCQTKSDDQYRAELTSQPLVMDLYDSGLDGTWTWNFNKDGSLVEKIRFRSPEPSYKGNITIDIQATWKVTNARLYIHNTKAMHNDTKNRKLNFLLDEMTYKLMQNPDLEINLSDCGHANSLRSIKPHPALSAAAAMMRQ